MANTQIYVLTKPKARALNFGFYALNSSCELIEGTIYAASKKSPATIAAKLIPSKYFMLRNCTTLTRENTHYLRITADTSQVFRCGPAFHIPQHVLDNFYTPPQVTVPEALASPKKRKITIEANVVEVKAIKMGDTWKRRDITIEDCATSKRVAVKLWNDTANEITENDTGNPARFSNLEVDIFNNKVQLKTLDMTAIEILAPAQTFQGRFEIVGVDIEEDIITVITSCGRMITMDHTVLQTTNYSTEDLIEATPITATLEVANGIISDITLPPKQPNTPPPPPKPAKDSKTKNQSKPKPTSSKAAADK